jgi:hypothetical protein
MMAADSISIAAHDRFQQRHKDTRMWTWGSPDAVSDEDLWCTKIRTADNFMVPARWYSLTVSTISALKDEISRTAIASEHVTHGSRDMTALLASGLRIAVHRPRSLPSCTIFM